jgi:hypothetical protein
VLPPIKLKPGSKWAAAGLITRAGIRLNRLQRMAAGGYQLQKPGEERMNVYVYSRVPGLVQVLEDHQLPLEVVKITPGSEDGRSRDL